MAYPMSKIAPTARAKCLQCGGKIEKGTTKLEVERTVSTPQGERTAAASLHAACAEAWVEASKWPGGLEDFARAVATNGEVPVAELAKHLGADASLPRGNPERVYQLLGEGQTSYSEPPQLYNDQVTQKIVRLLEAHRWEPWNVDRLTHPRVARLEVLQALIPRVPKTQVADVLGVFLAHLVPWHDRPEFRASLELLDAATPTIGPRACARLLEVRGSALPLVRTLLARVAAEHRVEALWGWADRMQKTHWVDAGGAPAYLPAEHAPQPAVTALLDTLDGSESWSGRHPIHAAVWAGSAELAARFPDRPLGEAVQLPTWAFGPNEKGQPSSFVMLDLSAGMSGAALATELLGILRAGQAALAGEYNPRLRPRDLEDRPHLLENALKDRAVLRPVVERRIKLYEAVVAQLGGAVANTPREPVADAPAPAKAPLPWLREHLRDIADDVFDVAHLEVRAASASGDVVTVEYVTSQGEELQTQVVWPNPRPEDEARLRELVDAMADDLSER